MTFIAVQCPHCHSEQIVKRGKTRRGTQRYLCQNMACAQGSFLLDYRNRGCLPEVKHTIIDRSLNASGVRDTARVLRISTDTVLSELTKKEVVLESVNTALLRTLHPDEVTVAMKLTTPAPWAGHHQRFFSRYVRTRSLFWFGVRLKENVSSPSLRVAAGVAAPAQVIDVTFDVRASLPSASPQISSTASRAA